MGKIKATCAHCGHTAEKKFMIRNSDSAFFPSQWVCRATVACIGRKYARDKKAGII